MATARCCPADCALRNDWEDELRAEKEMLEQDTVTELHTLMKLLSHPLRLKIILMLLKPNFASLIPIDAEGATS
ncbi:MAG: hypothetical protein WCH85_06160, partial [Methanomicrobiales archaeon]